MKDAMNRWFKTISLGFANGFGSAWFFIFMILVLISWIAIGAPLHWSNTWQLMANTPTTWIELFAAITIQYLTNIINNMQEEHQKRMDKMLDLTLTAVREIRKNDRSIDAQLAEILAEVKK